MSNKRLFHISPWPSIVKCDSVTSKALLHWLLFLHSFSPLPLIPCYSVSFNTRKGGVNKYITVWVDSVSCAHVQCMCGYVRSEKEVHRERGADGASTCLLVLLCLSHSPYLPSLPSSLLPPLSPPPCNAADAGKKYPLTSLFSQLTIHHTYSSHWYSRHTNTNTISTHATTRVSVHIYTHSHSKRGGSWWMAVNRVLCSHILIYGLFFPLLRELFKNKQDVITLRPIVPICQSLSYYCSNYQVFSDSHQLNDSWFWARFERIVLFRKWN